ncbi:DNA polymerase III subunit delta' [Lysinibacillus piscis]|uniref:DNA polymerase III subunit delta' n=1 Tax=Lysinibacillus piscis TaxID=2518931 RepID=A0ABQ5NPX2_9BACI|nr:DNA polymerase III subunit delta' [Lysinibacillus sp. KH24]GLC90374.1 DNA polymerase III subunit delta' [Lysinibacillus sp. KH24]
MVKNVDELLILQPVVMKQLQTIFEKNRLAHAYIFDGEKGTGKADIMQFFVKLMLCESPNMNVPCETCRNCRRVDSGNHPNIHQLYPDGQFIKIDQVRELMAELKMVGVEEGRKIYVLHHADRLNVASANMILKFLEEPEGEVTAILLTEQIQAVLPTIRSRCQYIKFQKMPRHVLLQQLQEHHVVPALASTVSMLTNEFENALFLANDEQFAHARKTVLKLVEAIQQNVHEAMLVVHEEWLPHFKEKNEIEQALDLLLFAYRDIVSIKANPEAACTYPDRLQFFKEIALHSTYEQLSSQMEAILQARLSLERNMNRALMLEQLMLNLQEGNTFV